MMIVDPGGTCGIVEWIDGVWDVSSCSLDDLPVWLDSPSIIKYGFLAAEVYYLQSSRARQQAGSDMPASQAIGMMRQMSQAFELPFYLIPRNAKRAGHQALDAAGQEAYAAARNIHQRDAVNLAGFVLREMRRKP